MRSNLLTKKKKRKKEKKEKKEKEKRTPVSITVAINVTRKSWGNSCNSDVSIRYGGEKYEETGRKNERDGSVYERTKRKKLLTRVLDTCQIGNSVCRWTTGQKGAHARAIGGKTIRDGNVQRYTVPVSTLRAVCCINTRFSQKARRESGRTCNKSCTACAAAPTNVI